MGQGLGNERLAVLKLRRGNVASDFHSARESDTFAICSSNGNCDSGSWAGRFYHLKAKSYGTEQLFTKWRVRFSKMLEDLGARSRRGGCTPVQQPSLVPQPQLIC